MSPVSPSPVLFVGCGNAATFWVVCYSCHCVLIKLAAGLTGQKAQSIYGTHNRWGFSAGSVAKLILGHFQLP